MKRKYISTSVPAETCEPESIRVTPAIAQRLMLAGFPNPDREVLSYPIPVKNVHPCPDCGVPVVLVRLDREVKLLDAFENPFSPHWWERWEADPIFGNHSCTGCGQ